MSKYCSEIDIDDPETTHVKLINLTGSGKKVLEVGCTNGRMSKYLQRNGCRVTGIEIDKNMAKLAETYCEEIIVGNIEEEEILSALKPSYDVVIFGDVLEHLVNPQRVLAAVSKLLGKGGYVLISIPNVAYFTVRFNLVFGNFDYNPEGGIMDNEHLRHFTLKTARLMIAESGFEIVSMDLLSAPRFKKSRYIYGLLKKFPSLFGYEFIFKVIPKTAGAHGNHTTDS